MTKGGPTPPASDLAGKTSLIVRNDPVVKGVVSVRAGDVAVAGEVRRADGSFVTLVDGSVSGGPAGLEFALYRLKTHLRTKLPVIAPTEWQVTVEGERAGTFIVTFGHSDLRFDADDRWLEPLWEVLQDLPRHTLSDAIESAAELVRTCVNVNGAHSS